MFREYGFVQNWLFDNSKRPAKECGKVWFEICLNLNPFSQDVGLSRQEIAANTGVKPCDVSTILNELASIGAVGIRKKGRETIYSINPQAIQNGKIFGVDIQKKYPLNLEATKSKSKKAASDEVLPQTCHNEAASEEKRGLKVIKGGLTSTMENMSSALAVHFPNPFDEAKKALEDIAVKSYAAVMADPSKAGLWSFWWINVFVLLADEIIKIYLKC